VLDELIAFGWTDGALKRLDNDTVMQRISPRRTDIWARTYQVRAARLLADGRMHAPGLAAVERAKASGLWDEHHHVDDLLIPDDLAASLGVCGDAAVRFDGYPPSHRGNVLRWLAKAKRPATRAARIAEITRHARAGTRMLNSDVRRNLRNEKTIPRTERR
jgi:uncharacterized protein YdeI (YjbR/CyaY-like superfamily)